MTDIVSPTPVGNAPPAPLVTDTPAEFNTKAFSLAGWYQPLVTALNGLTANVFNNATAAQERATAAGQSAVQAGERRDEARGARDEARGARDEAQVWATSAVNAPGTSGTSTSSLVVAAGTKTLSTQSGKAWVVGQPVVISRTSDPTEVQMWGTTSSYNAATGAMEIAVPTDGTVGGGTHSDWTIALVGRAGKAALLTGYTQSAVIQTSQQIAVPAGTRYIEALLCGGGNGGGSSVGGAFGGLLLFTIPALGAPLDLVVGAGGVRGGTGGETTVSVNGTIYAAVGPRWPGKYNGGGPTRHLRRPIWSAVDYPDALTAIGGGAPPFPEAGAGSAGAFGSGGGAGTNSVGGPGGSAATASIWGVTGFAGAAGMGGPSGLYQAPGGGGGGMLSAASGANGGNGGGGGGGGSAGQASNGGNGFAMFRFYK